MITVLDQEGAYSDIEEEESYIREESQKIELVTSHKFLADKTHGDENENLKDE